MSFVRAEISLCSKGTGNFPEGESSGVHSILSDMPSSLIFAFSSLLNSPFSEVDITDGEASIYLFSGAGTRVLELYQVLVYLGIHSSIDCSAMKLWPLAL